MQAKTALLTDRRGILAGMMLLLLGASAVPVQAKSEETAKSMSQEALYGDDETHPIPFLQALDVFAVKQSGGSSSAIVIASPLEADERSQRRLMRKIENYLGFIVSDAHREEAGPPDPSTTEILVVIDGRSDQAIFDLLEQCKPWALENGVTLKVERQAR